MTLPPAAFSGHQFPAAPVEFVPHPGSEHRLGCPTCNDTEHLMASYVVRTLAPVYVTEVPATSGREVEGADHVADPPGNWQQPVKIACGNCQWAYEGPDPLAKLVQVSE